MANQPPPPFNPFIFPYPYPFAPPPFMNPMMPAPPMNTHPHFKNQISYPPMPMPSYGYPPYPMMLPHSPDNFFPFFSPKPFKKQPEPQKSFNADLEINFNIPEERKASIQNNKQHSKKQPAIIVLSDDDQISVKMPVNIKPIQSRRKKDENKGKSKINTMDESQIDQIDGRLGNCSNIQSSLGKTHQIYKRKQYKAIQQKEKNNSKQLQKEPNLFATTANDSNNQPLARNKRMRILTAKDGKGKIMIGDEYQSQIPQFVSKNQSFTVWADSLRNNILSRSFQSTLAIP